MCKRTRKWLLITIVAALIAAVTTVLVLALRARAKKKAWYEEEASFDCDLDDEPVIEDAVQDVPAVSDPIE